MSSVSLESDAAPAVPPLSRHGVIQSDQFCDCGYNLFGQKVTRDERLGFEVVRCPECGRFSPAGHGTPSARPWLRRMATFMLAAWSLAILTGLGLSGLIMFGLLAGEDETALTSSVVTKVGNRPVLYDWDQNNNAPYKAVDTGERLTYAQIRYVRVPHGHPLAMQQSSNGLYQPDPPPWWLGPMFLGLEALVSLLVGTFVTAALWHVGWLRWLVLPWLVLPALILWLIVSGDKSYEFVRGWFAWHLAVSTLVILGGGTVGLLFGRSIARWLVRLLIPPRPRQALAFLWHADGKPMPISS